MDIVNTHKKQSLEAMEAERRHWERVRAGEQLLRHHEKRRYHHTSHHSSLLRRFFFVFGFFILAGIIGSIFYVGMKAYNASVHIASPSVGTSKKTYASSDTKTTPTHSSPQSDHSFVRDSLSAAGSLVGKRTPLRGEKDGFINILLLGKGSKGHPGENLTDTIMLARINVTDGKIALLSLPRDLYVRIPGTKSATKINALYDYGLRNGHDADFIIQSVIAITQLPIHYFLVADFDAFTSIVDALGGINVMVKRKINDTRYPGPHYSYETFTLEPGLTHMDGATALKYVRSRHGDPEGDFGRAKRQQQVLQAIKNKAFSLGTLSNPVTLGKIFDALGDHIHTDMSIADITSLVALLPQLDTQNITTVVIDAWQRDSLLRAVHIGKMFALVPRAGRFDYTEIRTAAHTIFERLARERVRTEIAREKPTILLVRAGAKERTVSRVRTLIADTLGIPLSQIRTITAHKGMRLHHAQIIDFTDTMKPFSLTALLRLLGAERITKASFSLENTDTRTDADIHIILGTQADDFFSESALSQEQFEEASAIEGDRVMIITEDKSTP